MGKLRLRKLMWLVQDAPASGVSWFPSSCSKHLSCCPRRSVMTCLCVNCRRTECIERLHYTRVGNAHGVTWIETKMDSSAKRGTEAGSCSSSDLKMELSSFTGEWSFEIPQIFSRRILENGTIPTLYQQEEGRMVLEKCFECLQLFSKNVFI